MNYKELFISADLDLYHYTAVIVDLQTNQIYNALFSGQQTGGGISYYIERAGTPITCERIKMLAEQSEDSRAKYFLGLKKDNLKKIIEKI